MVMFASQSRSLRGLRNAGGLLPGLRDHGALPEPAHAAIAPGPIGGKIGFIVALFGLGIAGALCGRHDSEFALFAGGTMTVLLIGMTMGSGSIETTEPARRVRGEPSRSSSNFDDVDVNLCRIMTLRSFGANRPRFFFAAI